MTQVADKTVLVTGAAMGMGLRHAQRAVAAGAARVILWDVNERALGAAAESLATSKTKILTQVVDISDVDSIEEGARRSLADAGPVHVLFNNAGIVTPGSFLDHTATDIERTIRINTLGVMHVARLFLPGMIASREAHLVNISSASALMPLPYGSVYASSKWAVYCWSDSVRLELKDAGHHHVKVTTVCPSFVATGMFEGAKAPTSTRFLTTDEIVNAIWRGMERNQPIVIAPPMAKIVLPLRALLPTGIFDFLADKVFGSYSAMKTLRGRGVGPKADSRPAASPELSRTK